VKFKIFAKILVVKKIFSKILVIFKVFAKILVVKKIFSKILVIFKVFAKILPLSNCPLPQSYNLVLSRTETLLEFHFIML
jgi:hypothetical protein